jgi:hypothetical protein
MIEYNLLRKDITATGCYRSEDAHTYDAASTRPHRIPGVLLKFNHPQAAQLTHVATSHSQLFLLAYLLVSCADTLHSHSHPAACCCALPHFQHWSSTDWLQLRLRMPLQPLLP